MLKPLLQCFRCGFEYNLIAKSQNPQKDNKRRQQQVILNEKGSCACNNGKNNSDQKIYAYMARVSGNDDCVSENFGDRSQLNNWIRDSGETCHMTPDVSDFITGSL